EKSFRSHLIKIFMKLNWKRSYAMQTIRVLRNMLSERITLFTVWSHKVRLLVIASLAQWLLRSPDLNLVWRITLTLRFIAIRILFLRNHEWMSVLSETRREILKKRKIRQQR